MTDQQDRGLSTLPECLDRGIIQSLLELGETEPTLFKELVETFISDTPPRLDAMNEAVASSNAEALERAAHGLKSSAGNMGARVLAELCRELEQKGRAGDLSNVEQLVVRARTEFDSAGRALRGIES